jgi:hypothetical protein
MVDSYNPRRAVDPHWSSWGRAHGGGVPPIPVGVSCCCSPRPLVLGVANGSAPGPDRMGVRFHLPVGSGVVGFRVGAYRDRPFGRGVLAPLPRLWMAPGKSKELGPRLLVAGRGRWMGPARSGQSSVSGRRVRVGVGRLSDERICLGQRGGSVDRYHGVGCVAGDNLSWAGRCIGEAPGRVVVVGSNPGSSWPADRWGAGPRVRQGSCSPGGHCPGLDPVPAHPLSGRAIPDVPATSRVDEDHSRRIGRSRGLVGGLDWKPQRRSRSSSRNRCRHRCRSCPHW